MKFSICLLVATGAQAEQVLPFPPAFSASIQYHQQTFSQDGVFNFPRFTRGHIKMDASQGKQLWELQYDRFKWVTPAMGNFWLKQMTIDDQYFQTDRNGTLCGPGITAYLNTMLTLWGQLYSVPEAGILEGKSNVFDVECDVWSVRNASIGNFSICLDRENVPRSVVVEPAGDAVGWSNAAEYSHNITFHDMAIGDDADMGGIEPESCWNDNMPSPVTSPEAWTCHNESLLESLLDPTSHHLEVLRSFGPPEPLGVLENRDTFDWVGLGVTLQEFQHNQYLELFEVEIDGHFGIWRDCNYNRVVGDNICSGAWPTLDKLVTRTSSEMLQGESMLGMCEPNSIAGSWYTFPLEGKCAEGASVGDDGCTWKLVRSKVIDMGCMKRHRFFGWFRASLMDYRKAPFPRVRAHVQSAMQSCPDVRESMLI